MEWEPPTRSEDHMHCCPFFASLFYILVFSTHVHYSSYFSYHRLFIFIARLKNLSGIFEEIFLKPAVTKDDVLEEKAVQCDHELKTDMDSSSSSLNSTACNTITVHFQPLTLGRSSTWAIDHYPSSTRHCHQRSPSGETGHRWWQCLVNGVYWSSVHGNLCFTVRGCKCTPNTYFGSGYTFMGSNGVFLHYRNQHPGQLTMKMTYMRKK